MLWPTGRRTGSLVSGLRGAVDDVLDAIMVPFPVNGVLGRIVYADYRNIVRPALQEYPMREPEDMMEVTEHGITSSVSSMIGPRTFARSWAHGRATPVIQDHCINRLQGEVTKQATGLKSGGPS